MTYTSSFLDAYVVPSNERQIIQSLRGRLKSISTDTVIRDKFSTQKSILFGNIKKLDDSLSSFDANAFVEEIDLEGTSAAVQRIKNAKESSQDPDEQDVDKVTEFLDYFLSNTFIGPSGWSNMISDGLSLVGLPEDWKDNVKFLLTVGFSALIIKLFGFPLVLGAGLVIGTGLVVQWALDIDFSLLTAQSISNWFSNDVIPFFSDLGNTVSNGAVKIWNTVIVPFAVWSYETVSFLASTLVNFSAELITNISLSIFQQGLPQTVFDLAKIGIDIIPQLYSDFKNIDLIRNLGITAFLNENEGLIGDILSGAAAGGLVAGPLGAIGGAIFGGSAIFDFISNFVSSKEVKNSLKAIQSVLDFVAPNFEDGVTETRFGNTMENSWNIFLSEALSEGSSLGVNFVYTTPLDPSFNQNYNLYGNMMLGAPLGYTRITDPNNRTMINTFVKDSVFLSLTPGMPKYNGGAFQQEVLNVFSTGQASSYLNQTQTAEEMRDYLFRNGLDEYFANKDTRYYTFESDYPEYFAYLETMLNTLWVKMGLGTNQDNTFNLFSFFEGSSDGSLTLSQRYNSSIGFFVNPVGDLSEAINSQTLSTDIGDDSNAAATRFQRLNYITGMGTAGAGRNAIRQIGVASIQAGTLGNVIRSNLDFSGSNFIQKGINLARSVVDFTTQQDLSAVVQQFTVTNGMRVMYPMLWENSSYNKNINFTFNFTSPYGDPLSIFQYVYVPFFSLLSFAMPRQAAENGLVSPFFVRADIPGWMTSDLALVTDVTWTRGGPDGTLWTKDKLPRSISGSFTITDLYPYLAAVKRISFLSANPSFTVFLDNLAGLRSLYNPNVNTDPFLEYWENMINRVNGSRKENNTLFNRFNDDKKVANAFFTRTNRESLTKSINKKSMPWLSKI
jgi:hypothetical protein